MANKPRLLRITTVPISLKLLLQGQLPYFKSRGYTVKAASAEGPEIESLLRDGIDHEVLHMTREITPLQDLAALYRAVRLIRRFRPDIVHTHTPKAGLIGMMAAWLCRVPVRMHTVAGMPLMERTGLTKRVLVLVEWLTYQFATHVYPNSLGLKIYIEKEIPRTKTPLRLIGKGSSNGIDTQVFQPAPVLEKQAADIRGRYGVRVQDIVFVFVGRIVRDKGISELVKAFKQLTATLQGRDQQAFLFLVGAFEEALDPLDPADDAFLKNSPQVVLSGFQSDVRPWIMSADVFVFPSYREGFPNVVMQACCLGVPCIVSDINGNNEIIQSGETGLIVPVKNADRLYESMLRLTKDLPLRTKLGMAGQQFVSENFERRHIWEELEKEYESLYEQRVANRSKT